MGQEMNRGAFLIIALSVLAFSHLFTGIVSAAETVINCRAHDGKCRLPPGQATVTLEIEPRPCF